MTINLFLKPEHWSQICVILARMMEAMDEVG